MKLEIDTKNQLSHRDAKMLISFLIDNFSLHCTNEDREDSFLIDRITLINLIDY